MPRQVFYKAQCNGNDFVLLLKNELEIKLDEMAIKKLCSRRRGVGADGLLLIDTSIDAQDFTMDYYNSDGSWETMCANGALCCVLLLQSQGYPFKSHTFTAGDGEHQIQFTGSGPSIKMKAPSDVTGQISVQGCSGAHIDSGAKHFVTLCDERDCGVLYGTAQLIRNDDMFKPSGLNVNFLTVRAADHIDVVTYEKGIEKIMLSCGSGSVAAAFYVSQHSKLQSPLRISNPGGEMHLTFNEDWTDLWLSSHPMILFSSTIDLDLIDLG